MSSKQKLTEIEALYASYDQDPFSIEQSESSTEKQEKKLGLKSKAKQDDSKVYYFFNCTDIDGVEHNGLCICFDPRVTFISHQNLLRKVMESDFGEV